MSNHINQKKAIYMQAQSIKTSSYLGSFLDPTNALTQDELEQLIIERGSIIDSCGDATEAMIELENETGYLLSDFLDMGTCQTLFDLLKAYIKLM